MEDQERGMETIEPRLPPVKKSPRRENRLHIMIMGRVGSVRSFKISTRILFWTALFLLLYISFSIMIINRYFDLRYAHQRETKNVSRLEKENARTHKSLLRSRQHVTLLKEYIEYLEKPSKRPAQIVAEEKPKASETQLPPEKSAPEKKPEMVEARPSNIVNVTDLVIEIEGTWMTVDFKLVNTQPGETAIGGYIHMIAKNMSATPPQSWTYPQAKLVNGFPENFRRGQLFLIQRFKPVQGKFSFPAGADPPSIIQVLVYDQSGIIIFDKDFEVNRVP